MDLSLYAGVASEVYMNHADEEELPNNSASKSPTVVYTVAKVPRINSPKQTKASRQNGSKSIGPSSQAGKKKAAQNAIQDGLFSRQVVIEQLGEKQAKFERMQKLVRKILRPLNTIEEMLAADVIENWWRRERMRRAETSELENRLAWLDMRHELRREDEIEALRSRFCVLFAMYLKAFGAGSLEAVAEITRELEEVRQQLISNTLGIDFLVGILKYLAGEAKKKGLISTENEILLKACCGFASQDADVCLKFNEIAKRQSQNRATKDSEQSGGDGEVSSERDTEILRVATKLRTLVDQYRAETKDKNPDDESSKQNKMGNNCPDQPPRTQEDEADRNKADDYLPVAAVIDVVARNLGIRRIKFQLIEAAEARRASSLAISDPSSTGRFSRAETAVERRMYRALALLTAMRAQGTSNLLPEPRPKTRK
jgi:hypothetical protein